MNKTKIFIIMGQCGHWEDSVEWIVCAFKDKEKAEDRIKKLEKLAKEMKISGYSSSKEDIKKFMEHIDGDPNFSGYDDDGVEYSLVENIFLIE